MPGEGDLCPEWGFTDEMGTECLVSGFAPVPWERQRNSAEGESTVRVEKRRVRGGGGCNSAGVSSPQQHIPVLERGRRRTKRCRGRAGLRDVSTPSGNRSEQKSHRKPRSHGAADLSTLQLCCPTGQVHPAGTVGTGGHCGDPGLSQPPPLALEGQKGRLSRRQSKPQGLYLSGEILSGCSCPFSSRSPSVVSAPAAVSGLVVWLGFGTRLELGASVPGQETFPAGSWSVLAIVASLDSAFSSSCSASPAAEGGSVPGSGALDISGHLRLEETRAV